MKLVGFIYEYNPIPSAVPIKSISKNNGNSAIDLDKIVQYLNAGELVFGWMGYFQDFETKAWIAPDSYVTDGDWVWPSYLPYYLQKGFDSLLDIHFLDHIQQKNFKIDLGPELTNAAKVLEKELSDLLTKYP